MSSTSASSVTVEVEGKGSVAVDASVNEPCSLHPLEPFQSCESVSEGDESDVTGSGDKEKQPWVQVTNGAPSTRASTAPSSCSSSTAIGIRPNLNTLSTGSLFDMLGEGEQANNNEDATLKTVQFGRETIRPAYGDMNTNSITTGIYSVPLMSFAIVGQFPPIVNLCFLLRVITVLDMSKLEWFTTLMPLAIVFVLAAIQELHQNRRKRAAEHAMNNQTCHVLNRQTRKEWVTMAWSDVRDGDILRIAEGERIPADAVLLSVSSNGMHSCFVNQANCDGSSRPTAKRAVIRRKSLLSDACIRSKGYCTIANETYIGEFALNNEQPVRILRENVLFRGSVMNGVPFAYALVMFTGMETEIWRMRLPRCGKRSIFDSIMVHFVTVSIVVLFSVSLFSTVSQHYMQMSTNQWYLKSNTTVDTSGFIATWWFFVSLYINLIPVIPVYLTTAVVEAILARWMEKYTDPTDSTDPQQQRMTAESTAAHMQLGTVGIVLSDKTGTITTKQKELTYCSSDNVLYSVDPRERPRRERPHASTQRSRVSAPTESRSTKASFNLQRCHNIEPFASILPGKPETNQRSKSHYFLLAMATCNSARNRGIEINTSLPYCDLADERVVFRAASTRGYNLFKVTDTHVHMDERGERVIYDVLYRFAFDTRRNRSSIILRSPTGEVICLCKGSVDAVMGCCSVVEGDKSVNFADLLEQTGFSVEVFAMKLLRTRDLINLKELLSSPARIICDTETSDDVLQSALAFVETHMTPLGVTAIEEILQKDVIKTIGLLREANISFWLVTGDDLKHALGVARRAEVIHPHTQILKLSFTSSSQTRRQFFTFFTGGRYSMADLAFVVDGKSFETITADTLLRSRLLRVLATCRVVIAASFSSEQKEKLAAMAKIITSSMGNVVLAMGDGANDIRMMTAADIGVAVGGSREADLSCDYSISEFRLISRLIMLHGQRCYDTTGAVIYYCFYKESCVALITFYHGFNSMFSGSVLYAGWQMLLWQFIFTGVPIVVFAKHNMHGPLSLKERAKTHFSRLNHRQFTYTAIFYMLALAVCQSTIIYISCAQIQRDASSNLGTPSVQALSLACLTITVNLQLLLRSHTPSRSLYASVALSIISCISFYFLTNDDGVTAFHSIFWLVLLVVPIAALLPQTLLDLFIIRWSRRLRSSGSFSESSSSDHNYSPEPKSTASLLSRSTASSDQPSVYLGFVSNPELEMQFRRHITRISLPITRNGAIMVTMATVLYHIYGLVNATKQFSIVTDAVQLSLACIIIIATSPLFQERPEMTQVMLALGFCVSIVKNLTLLTDGYLTTALFPTGVFLLIRIRFPSAIALSMFDILTYNAVQITKQSHHSLVLFNFAYSIMFIVPCYYGYQFEEVTRRSFASISSLRQELFITKMVLSKMLPAFMQGPWRSDMVQASNIIARLEPVVNVMFVALVNFNEIVSGQGSTHSLVQNLDKLFSAYDDICEAKKIHKIETVGNVFVACTIGKMHMQNLVDVGLQIIHLLEEPRFKDLYPDGVRVGINSGEALFGVISQKRPTLSIFGDTVNTASRMCSHGTPGKVTLSAASYELVKNYYSWSMHQVEVKGKGLMDCYRVGFRLGRHQDCRVSSETSWWRRRSKVNSMGLDFLENDRSTNATHSSTKDLDIGDSTVLTFMVKEPLLQVAPPMKDEYLAAEALQARHTLAIIFIFSFFFPTLRIIESTFAATGSNFAVEQFAFSFILAVIGVGILKFRPILHRYSRSSLAFIVTIAIELLFDLTASPGCQLPISICLLLIVLSNSGILLTYLLRICAACIVVIVAIFYVANGRTGIPELIVLLLITACAIVNVFTASVLSESMRRSFILSVTIKEMSQRSDSLLAHMLPDHVIRELKSGAPTVSHEYHRCSILYADIVAFTSFAAANSPTEIVSLLSTIFSRFDSLVSKRGLCKVQTIGDAYVVVAGLHDSADAVDASKNATKLATMAGKMLDAMLDIRCRHGYILQIRIGIHTGKVVAGVIGTHRLRFDIWGRDAMIANMVEQNGIPRRVVVSESTHALLGKSPSFRFAPYKNITVEKRNLKLFVAEELPGVSSEVAMGELSVTARAMLWPQPK